ncbi:acyltransferase family protein [Bradyrhizobium sp.]|uniref:acyltransferase family protein n=1 Tax=Bradyrhizobium sp. TaxID=376 RepID=UPI003C3E1F14
MKRIEELDGLRAIATLMVIAWHYIGIPDGPDSWLWRVFYLGHFGVDLFFVLSGYLITMILLENRESESYFSSFYGRRALRIWPFYYLMCAICFIGWRSGASPALFRGAVPGWTYIFGVQNVWMAKLQTFGANWLGGTWSLAIEEQFYLVFPLIVRFVPVDVLPKILVTTIVICPLGRLIDSFTGDQFGYYVLPQFRADVLSIGALIAWWRLHGARASGPDDAAISRTVRRILAGSVLLPPLIWLSGSRAVHAAAWQHSFAAVFFGALLVWVLQRQGTSALSWLRGPVMSFFAKTSYAAYLTHYWVAYLVFAVLGVAHVVSTMSGAATTLASFAVTFGLCALSYAYFERPLIELAHRRFRFQQGESAAMSLLPSADS